MSNIFCSCGILLNDNNETLLLSRNHKKYLKSYYEFPGGKVENGENFYLTIIRELKEELNIILSEKQIKPFKFVQYKYSKFNLIMHSFIIKQWSGNIENIENTEIKWIKIKKLSRARLLPGNKDLIGALKIF